MNTLNDELSRVSRPCPHDAGRELAVPSTLLPNSRSFLAGVLTLLGKRSLWSAGARCDEPTVLLKWRRNKPPAIFSNSEEIKERLLVMLPLKQLCACMFPCSAYALYTRNGPCKALTHAKFSRRGSYRYDYSWREICVFSYVGLSTCLFRRVDNELQSSVLSP